MDSKGPFYLFSTISEHTFWDRHTAITCNTRPGVEGIGLVSCSTQLSIKFKLLMNTGKAKINVNFRFKSQEPGIYPTNKC